jgi:hypothetical protein
MTVFRVNPDKDDAQVIGLRHFTHRITKDGPQSLSAISMKYFGTYKLWPVIWRMNLDVLIDPNKTRKDMVIKVPKAHTLSTKDRMEGTRIFLMWKDVDKAIKMLEDWIKRDHQAGIELTEDEAILIGLKEPAWVRWNSSRP